MSWLFDRLCDLAVADHVVAAVALSVPVTDEALRRDVADLLVRASQARQFDLWVAVGREPGGDAGAGEVEIDDLGGGRAFDAVLSRLERCGTTFVAHAVGGGVRFGEPSIDEPLWGPRPSWDLRWLYATDRPVDEDGCARFAERDLAIVVDRPAPPGAHPITGVAGLVAVLDALITLRHYAFGLPGDDIVGAHGAAGTMVSAPRAS